MDLTSADFTLATHRTWLSEFAYQPSIRTPAGMSHLTHALHEAALPHTEFAQTQVVNLLISPGRESDADMVIPGCLQRIPGAFLRLSVIF